jgi:hypothetical protein
MDVIRFRWNRCIFKGLNDKWFNPALSWKNKWKNGIAKQGERFLGSSTIFAFLTDFWHLSKFLMIVSYILSICFYSILFSVWIDAILFFLITTITFEIFFSVVFIVK